MLTNHCPALQNVIPESQLDVLPEPPNTLDFPLLYNERLQPAKMSYEQFYLSTHIGPDLALYLRQKMIHRQEQLTRAFLHEAGRNRMVKTYVPYDDLARGFPLIIHDEPIGVKKNEYRPYANHQDGYITINPKSQYYSQYSKLAARAVDMKDKGYPFYGARAVKGGWLAKNLSGGYEQRRTAHWAAYWHYVVALELCGRKPLKDWTLHRVDPNKGYGDIITIPKGRGKTLHLLDIHVNQPDLQRHGT